MCLEQLILLALLGNISAFYPFDCQYDPVCATDGNTYTNQCEFRKSKMYDQDLLIIIHAPCPTLHGFTQKIIQQPYKLSNTVTEKSTRRPKYKFKKRRLMILLAVYSLESYAWKCSRNYRPMCASNGHTYNNACDLLNAKMDDKDLQILFSGECIQILALLNHFNRQLSNQRLKQMSGWTRNENYDLLFLQGPLHNILLRPRESRHGRV